MRAVLISTAAAALLAGVIGVSTVVAAPAGQAIPERADNFQLNDTTRMGHLLQYDKTAPAVVLMTQTNGSKYSRAAAAELAKLQDAYKAKGVIFYMINADGSPAAAATEADTQKFAMPLLVDDLQLVSEQLGAKREGEIYVLSPKNGYKVAYHGPLDSRFTSDAPNLSSAAKTSYAADAIDALIAGSAVTNARVDVKAGKSLALPEVAKQSQHAKISYTKTVAPIIQEKCASCHTKGGIGPFALDSYETVKAWAPMMRESVRARRMPPWFSDLHGTKFSNDYGLTADQSKTLIHWIEAGANRDAGEDILKTQAKEAPEWPVELGKPDYIVKLQSFDVPASGTIPYQSFKVDSPFKEDVWLKAVVFKPGARPVLHHITSGWSRDPKLPQSGIPASSVGSFVPGAGVQVYNEGTGAPVPAGGTLRYSMHYTTTGKAMTDQTTIGYYVTKTTPEIIRRGAVISDAGLLIPSGEARHEEVSYMELPAEAMIYSVHPHAHYRGYAVELTAKEPNGKITQIMSVPKYDFNWQLDYDLEKPMVFPKGTKLIVKWVYDNSTNNVANPDPKIDVKWGEQTWQEMMYFRVNYRWMDETSSKIRNDLQDAFMKTRSVGSLDDNADGLVQVNELRGTSAAMKPRFAELDTNKDGGLDANELAAGGVGRLTRQQQEEIDSAL